MALMLGSFANGLFSGAQSAFQLYGQYQGVKAMMAQSDAADKLASIDAMNQANAGVIGGWDKDKQQPYGQYEPSIPPTGTTEDSGSSSTGGTPDAADRGRQKEPAATPAKPTESGSTGTRPGAELATSDPWRNPVSTGVPAAPAPDTYTPSPQTAPIWNQNNPVGTESLPSWGTAPIPTPYGQLGTPTALPAPWTPPPPAPVLSGSPSSAAGVQGLPGTPSGPAIRPATIAPPSPPSVTLPTNAPIPSTQPGGPFIPPPQRPAEPVSPAGGAPVQGGIPQASAAPPSFMSKVGNVLGAFNPIGTAQASEGVPGPPPAAPAPAAALTPPAAPTPATPPTAAPAAPAVAPVPVAGGKGAAVAPGQTTPSKQSEATPAPIAPPIDPGPWVRLQRDNPQLAQAVKTAVDRDGGGAVTYEQVAAHMWRESRFNVNVGVGSYGEHGLMQIWPPTQQAMEKLLGHTVDADSVDGSLQLGVTYLKYLARDEGLGANSVQTNFAYMRGPGAVANIAQSGLDAATKGGPYAQALKYTAEMYPGVKLVPTMFTGGARAPGATQYNGQAAMAAAQGGPDRLLQYVATNGPPGLGMSERWSSLQTSLERSAILSGHFDMLPHIQDWVAQQSHQGALSNLAAADAALAQGNGNLAAQYLAKAHAFFPDGSYARFGTDSKGNVWGEQFTEANGTSTGKPIQITPDMLRQQMITLQNPRNYVQALQEYQKNNALIDQAKSHAEYYREMPEAKAQVQTAISARQQDKFTHDQEMQNQRLQHQEQMHDLQNQNQNADAHAVNAEINKDYADGPNAAIGEVPETFGKQAQVDTALRRNRVSGGAEMAGPMARETARDLVNGNAKLVPGKDKNGNTGYAVVGKDGTVRGYLSTDQGDRIRGLAGSEKLAPAKTEQHTSVVGAGAGSQLAAAQGMNQNLSGIPMQTQQQAA